MAGEVLYQFDTPNPFGEAFGSIGESGMNIAQILLAREAIERQRGEHGLRQQYLKLQLDQMAETVKAKERALKARERLAKQQGGQGAGQPQGSLPQNPFIRGSEDREAMRMMEMLPDLLEAYPQAADAVLGKLFGPEPNVKGVPMGMFRGMSGPEQKRLMGTMSPMEEIGQTMGPSQGPVGPGMAVGPIGGPVQAGAPAGMQLCTEGLNLPPGMDINIGGIRLKGGEAAEGRQKRLEWAGKEGYRLDDPNVRRYVVTGDPAALPSGPTPKGLVDVTSGRALDRIRRVTAEAQEYNLKVTKGEIEPSMENDRQMLASLTKSREGIEVSELDQETRTTALQNIDTAMSVISDRIARRTAGPEAVEGRRALLSQARDTARAYGSRKAALAAVDRQPPEHRALFRQAINLEYPR